MLTLIRRLWKDDRGGALLEYGAALALFAVGCMLAFANVATSANAAYSTSTNSLTAIQESPLPTTVP